MRLRSVHSMAEYKVIDNFLPQEEFEKIRDVFLGRNISWFYEDAVVHDGVIKDDFYLVHMVYDHTITSDYYQLLEPIIKKIDAKAIMRVKANMYPKTDVIHHHDKHTDLPYEHKGAIYYINTNNGLTVLDDGTEIESVENRILLFDASKEHNSTTCSDKKVRVNINFNYF